MLLGRLAKRKAASFLDVRVEFLVGSLQVSNTGVRRENGTRGWGVGCGREISLHCS